MYSFVIYTLALYILYLTVTTIIRRVKYDIHRIPKAPTYPLIGHLHHFIGFDKPRFSLWLYKWYQKLGHPPVMLMDTMFSKTVVVTDNSFCHQKIYSYNGYPKAKAFYHTVLYAMDDKRPSYTIFTILNLNSYWKAIHKGLSSSFSPEGLRQKFPIILSRLNKFEDFILNSNKSFEGQLAFTLFTLDAIVHSGLEFEYDTYNKGKKLIEDCQNCTMNSNIKIFVPFLKIFTRLFPNSALAQKLNDRYLCLREITQEILLNYKLKKNIDENNLSIIANLFRIIDPETGEKLTDFKLLGEISTMVFAGFSATGNQLAWIFTCLNLYPESEEKILEELKNNNLIGSDSKKLEYNDLSKLTYLNAFIKECMRMTGTLSFATTRDLPNDDVVCGYRLPKGMVISVLNKAIHRNETIWEKPNEFMPERWMGTNISGLTKNMCSFSFGPRRCIGMQFAMVEIMTTLVCLVSKYKIRFINEDKKSLEELINETFDSFTLSHEFGLYFEIQHR